MSDITILLTVLSLKLRSHLHYFPVAFLLCRTETQLEFAHQVLLWLKLLLFVYKPIIRFWFFLLYTRLYEAAFIEWYP